MRRRKYSRQTSYQDRALIIPEDDILNTKPNVIQGAYDENKEKDGERLSLDNKKTFKIGKDLIEDEDAKVTSVGLDVYLYYAKSAGFLFSFFGAFFYACFQIFTVSGNLWLSAWSSDKEATTNDSKKNMYLAVYGGTFPVAV